MNQLLIRIFKNHAIFVLIALVIGSLQTTLWPFVTGLRTSPQLWLIFLSYFILTRNLRKAIVIVYFYGFLFSHFSLHPVGYFYFSLLLLTVIISFFRDRLLGPGGSSGGTYLLVSMTATLLLWHSSTWLITWMFDDHATPALILTRGFEWLLTMPFVAPLHSILRQLDKPSDRPSVLATIVTARMDE